MTHKADFSGKLRILIVTVSTSRTKETDSSGESLRGEFERDGHLVDKIVVRDSEEQVVGAFYSNKDSDVFVFVGGTGPSSRDVTVQSLRKISEREMVGFGELFRSSSKTRFAYLSNSTLFIKDRKQLYCIPGSPEATKVAHDTISSLMGHLFDELHKD